MKNDDVLFLVGFILFLLFAFTFSFQKKPATNTISTSTGTSTIRAVTINSPTGVTGYSSPQYGNDNEEKREVSLRFASPTYVSPGNFMILTGQGFTETNNVVHFGNTLITIPSTKKGTEVRFKVPFMVNSQTC